jgi:hypothetical protein
LGNQSLGRAIDLDSAIRDHCGVQATGRKAVLLILDANLSQAFRGDCADYLGGTLGILDHNADDAFQATRTALAVPIGSVVVDGDHLASAGG